MARRIRFFFEWGHDWPLWESFTEKYTMEPSEYGLSEELTEMLRASYRTWIDHCEPFHGWDRPESEARWRHQSDQALAVLRREVQGVADVVDERRR